MANLIEMSEQLKGVPDDWLQQQIQNPSGAVPPYLMLGEMNRRKSLRSRMTQPPTTTVAEDVLRSGQPAPPGMASTDVLGARPQMPQQPQTPRPGVPSPVPGGLSAAAPPAPQGPPAPQRMAAGGLIRAAGGLFVNPFDKFRKYEEEEEEDLRGPGVYLDSRGSLVRRAGKPDMLIAAPPKPQFAPYREPTPVDIKMPDLTSVLEQIRSVTKEPEGASAKLDQRIAELEQQRSSIRQPRTGDALIEMGLGMMGSRSPYALQALGEAGLGAMQSHRARQTQAQQQQTALSERLAAIEAARYEQQERGRRADLSAAQELSSKQYGAEMVKAQLASQADSSRRAYDLAVAEAGNRAGLSGYDAHTGLQKALLQAELQEGRENIDPNSPEGIAAQIKIARGREQAQRDFGTGGAGRVPRSMSPLRAKIMAEGLVKGELLSGKWAAGAGETVPGYFQDRRETIAQEIESGKRFSEYDMSDEDRYMVAMQARNMSPRKDDRFWPDLKTSMDKNRKSQPAQEETEYGGMKRSGADKGVRDLSDLQAQAKAKAAAAAVHNTGTGSRGGFNPKDVRPAPVVPPISQSKLGTGRSSRGGGSSALLPGTYSGGAQGVPRASLDILGTPPYLEYQDEEDYFNRRNDPYYPYYRDNLMGGFAG